MIRVSPPQLATLVIAAVFVARALLRMVQPEFNVLRFAVIGWPPWSVWAVSFAEVVGAALLVQAVTFRFGALLLGAVAGAFLVTYLRIGAPSAGIGSGGMLLALIGLALWRARRAP